jgi:hypothetical protein
MYLSIRPIIKINQRFSDCLLRFQKRLIAQNNQCSELKSDQAFQKQLRDEELLLRASIHEKQMQRSMYEVNLY